MKFITKVLVLCLWVCRTYSVPMPTAGSPGEDLDRCEGIEFDAITPDEKGNYFFFKGNQLWKGFEGPVHMSNEFFEDLGDIHVDAAFRMHNKQNSKAHDHIFFFQGDKVLSYYNHTLEDGYPKLITEDFPGVPSDLDAALECPEKECKSDSVLFFKGNEVYVFDIATKTVKTKNWSHLPVCTSALQWLEKYYCFHGHSFTRFHPVTGVVTGNYPKDARKYFMRCSNLTHGGDYQTPKCSEINLDAITTDDSGKSYLFRGPIFMRLDTRRDGLHAFPINTAWKMLPSNLEAVFSYADKMYFIKDNQVYIYKGDAHNTLIDGYPKSLSDELGLEGLVDAAFVCPNQHVAHIIQGKWIRDVDLSATPRTVGAPKPLPLKDIDAGLCSDDGISLFKGPDYYHYLDVNTLVYSRIAPVPIKITSDMIGCRD